MRDPSEVIAACPFCGAPGEIMETTATTPHVIACCSGDCELMPSTHPQLRQSAIATWNRRATPQPAAIAEAAEDLRVLLRETRGWIGNTSGTAPQPADLIARIDAALSTVAPVREG